jgi:hypothetical protein
MHVLQALMFFTRIQAKDIAFSLAAFGLQESRQKFI